MQEHILVVDDEASVRNVLVGLLAAGGYSPTPANGLEEAMRLLRERPNWDLVLTDLMMPATEGLVLLDAIGRDYSGIPVVLLTAVDDIHIATNAFRRGVTDYLLKPISRDELLSAVTRALEHGHLLRQSAAYRHNLEEMVSHRTGRLRAAMNELEKSYDITLEAMGDALDLRDAETEGHSRRVTAYTVALARRMQIAEDQLPIIARGAFLHDIGKIATPDRILLKPGKLDGEETLIMHEHCARGYEMVRKIPFLREAAEIIYSHQEAFDGSGYPRGLRGEEIPLGARIFAIADTLDAMTSDRPYRKGLPFATARDEIARASGRQFDPSAVEAFLSIPEETWHTLRREVESGSASVLGVPLNHAS